LGPPGTAATNSHIVPAPGDYDDGEIGDWQGIPKYSEKTCSSAACPPQTSYAAWTGARAAAVGSQRLTA
jgi:hypothetical protein